MKNFPEYKMIMYYFVDKTRNSKLISSNYESCCGVLLHTENNTFFFNPFRGSYIIPDYIQDKHEMVPIEWFSEEAMKWAIKNQQFDSDYSWVLGNSMYSKNLFVNILNDIRDFKINSILND